MTAKSKVVRAKLEAAAEKRLLVRIERGPRHADRLDGFVIAVGRKWVLVAKTMDGGYFDGYVAIRVRDVRRVTRDRSFEGVFARTQAEWPPTAPGAVDLDSTKRMLRSLAATAPLVGLEKEREREGLWIGVVVDLRRGWVRLREVRPDATWHRRPVWYECRAVTKVSVGTHYLVGLATVACAGITPPR